MSLRDKSYGRLVTVKLEQAGLSGGTAKGSGRGSFVGARLVETESLTMNGEESFGRRPVFAFAAHAFTKDTRVELTVACFANAVQHTISFRRQLLTQTLFKIRRDTPGQTQHVYESELRTRVFRALQQDRYVTAQTGNHRRNADADCDAGARERFHRVKARLRQRRVRLDRARDLDIRERNRQKHTEMRLARQLLQHVDVPTDHRRLRDDPDRLLKLDTNFQTSSRQFVIRFERNIRIGRKPKDDLVAFPRRFHQFLSQQLRRLHLGNDLAIEVRARAVTEIFVRRTAEAVSATVNATAITIDGVVKADVGTVVVRDDLASLSLFENFEFGFRRFADPFDGVC